MSLSSALNVAQSSLSVTGLQTTLISRNVASSDNEYYNRKSGLVSTTYGGGVTVSSIGRAMNTVLFTNKLDATSASSAQKAIVEKLNQLEATVNDPELDQSLAAQLGALNNALQQYSITPDDPLLAQEVLSTADALARGLNQASQTVAEVREQADADMAAGVTRVNGLLAEFEGVNRTIVKGTQSGADITDQLDTRDRILSQLSEEIGLSVSTRANNDTVIYTDGGVTLFETTPRKVAMLPSIALGAGLSGQALFVDGVAVTGQNAVMPLKSGQIYGSAVIRDDLAVTYQNQLDEIARGLVEAFAETDQAAVPALPPQAGLFTYGGGPVVPATGVLSPGLAASIRINPNADPARGGDLDRLRDGGISDPTITNYVYNTSGGASFSGRIQGMLTALSSDRTFSAAAKADPSNSLAGFAASSVGWLEAQRKSGTTTLGYETAALQRTSQALSNATGVNVDEEMTLLMELERSYKASSTLISTIDEMLKTLLDAVR